MNDCLAYIVYFSFSSVAADMANKVVYNPYRYSDLVLMVFCKPVMWLTSCVLQDIQSVIDQFEQYSIVWNQERDAELNAFLDADPRLSDFEEKFHFYQEFEERFLSEPDCVVIGPIAIHTGNKKKYIFMFIA